MTSTRTPASAEEDQKMTSPSADAPDPRPSTAPVGLVTFEERPSARGSVAVALVALAIGLAALSETLAPYVAALGVGAVTFGGVVVWRARLSRRIGLQVLGLGALALSAGALRLHLTPLGM